MQNDREAVNKKKKMNLVKTIYWYKNVYVEIHGMP